MSHGLLWVRCLFGPGFCVVEGWRYGVEHVPTNTFMDAELLHVRLFAHG